MPRTDRDKVRAVISTQPDVDLTRHINTAAALTDWLSANDSLNVLNASLLLEIETYLAAHFYHLRDQQYTRKKTGDAEADFQTGLKGRGLQSSDWGQQAVDLDVSGQLATLGQSRSVGIYWLGLPESEQLSYDDRN